MGLCTTCALLFASTPVRQGKEVECDDGNKGRVFKLQKCVTGEENDTSNCNVPSVQRRVFGGFRQMSSSDPLLEETTSLKGRIDEGYRAGFLREMRFSGEHMGAELVH